MKKIIEWLKDFLYDSIDYIIMIGIIGAVALIIGWRLDLLFAKEAAELPPNDNIIVEKPRLDNRENKPDEGELNEDIPNPDDNIDENDENDDNNGDNPIMDENDENNQVEAVVVKVVIPPGSLPSKIASILEEHNLISSRAEFVQKSQELKLDTKLKSGTFEIKSNSSLEEIIKIIAK